MWVKRAFLFGVFSNTYSQPGTLLAYLRRMHSGEAAAEPGVVMHCRCLNTRACSQTGHRIHSQQGPRNLTGAPFHVPARHGDDEQVTNRTGQETDNQIETLMSRIRSHTKRVFLLADNDWFPTPVAFGRQDRIRLGKAPRICGSHRLNAG